MKTSLISKYGIKQGRLLTRGFGGSVPLRGPPGTDSKRVEIRVLQVGSTNIQGSSKARSREQNDAKSGLSINHKVTELVKEGAAHAQKRAYEAERQRIALEEKEKIRRETLRKDREKLRRIKKRRDEMNRAAEIKKLVADSKDKQKADKIKHDYAKEKAVRVAIANNEILETTLRERNLEEGSAVREILNWERQSATEVQVAVKSAHSLRAEATVNEVYIASSLSDEYTSDVIPDYESFAELQVSTKQEIAEGQSESESIAKMELEKDIQRLQMETSVSDALAKDLKFARLLLTGNPSGPSKSDISNMEDLQRELLLNKAHLKSKQEKLDERLQNVQTSAVFKQIRKTSSFSHISKKTKAMRRTVSYSVKRSDESGIRVTRATWNIFVQTKLDASLPRTVAKVDPFKDTPDTLMETLKLNKNLYIFEVIKRGSGLPREPRLFLLQSRKPLKHQLDGNGSWLRLRRRATLKPKVSMRSMHRYASFHR